MACIALKSNGRPCRNYASLEEEGGKLVRGFTCSSHKHYFDNPEEIKRGWIKYSYASYLHHYDRKRECVETALANGLVKITEEDVKLMRNSSNPMATGRCWGYFILLIARYTEGYSPEWNTRVWIATVMNVWRWIQGVGPVPFTWEDLQALICVKGDSWGALYWWNIGLRLYPDYGERGIGFTEEDCFRFFQSCLEYDPVWASEILNESEEAWIKQRNKPFAPVDNCMMDIITTDRLWNWKVGQLALFKEDCRFKIFELKEEIIAAGWHPDRFMSWCVDWEEKKDMEDRWA